MQIARSDFLTWKNIIHIGNLPKLYIQYYIRKLVLYMKFDNIFKNHRKLILHIFYLSIFFIAASKLFSREYTALLGNNTPKNLK